MERRKLITSMFACLGAGASTGAAGAKPQVSKTSTRCEVSEYAHKATEASQIPMQRPSSAPTQKPASPRE